MRPALQARPWVLGATFFVTDQINLNGYFPLHSYTRKMLLQKVYFLQKHFLMQILVYFTIISPGFQ